MTFPPLALVGSGEYLPQMAEVDRRLLERTGKSRPRVALVPTAAGREDPRQWTDRGERHFAELAADPVPVFAVDRASCDDARWARLVEEADLIYFSGGKPGHLVESLRGTLVWGAVARRHAEGAVLAGSSAGAMMLGERTFVPDEFDERGVPRTIGVIEGFGLLSGVIVVPHFDLLTRDDDLGRALRPLFLGHAPHDLLLLGIEEETALLRFDGLWCVAGKGSVHVGRGATVERRYPSGTLIPADAF